VETRKHQVVTLTQLVLVVDDTKIARQGTALTLREFFSYRIDKAVDGYAAIDSLRNRNYAAVLMDCDMPGMSGFECTQQIRELEKHSGKRTPVIGMSAGTTSDVRERCLKSGMDDYLDKGCSIYDLRRTMLKWTKKSIEENHASF
jgi:CheY-like chemotaxis protein